MIISSTLQRILEYLERHIGEWILQDRIEYLMAQNDLHEWGVFKQLKLIANVGSQWNKEKRSMEYKWYERREGDDFTQKALDEFDT